MQYSIFFMQESILTSHEPWVGWGEHVKKKTLGSNYVLNPPITSKLYTGEVDSNFLKTVLSKILEFLSLNFFKTQYVLIIPIFAHF